MRSILSVAIVLALAACGGGSGGSGSGSSGTGTGTGGSETPVATGEDEGFDDDGMADADPEINHGSQSPHELMGVHPPPTPWANMSQEEREYYMVGVFMPIQGESFSHYDASRFATFECENCHGEDPRARHFEMPSNALPPLAAPGTPQWEQMTHGPAYAFMNDTIVTEGAILLGRDRQSAEHPDGFYCFDCHPHAQ